MSAPALSPALEARVRAGVVRLDEAVPLTDRAQLLVDGLDLEEVTGVEGARWERFQLAHLNDDGRFRIEQKSRQVAFSWLCAAEAVADAVLTGASTAFVSINEEEAQEKVRYAKAVYHALDVPWGKPAVVRDSLTSLELASGTRLLSGPAKPIRGKSRFNVVFDEFAHVPNDREVYAGSLPVITRGGRVRMGSSPFGASGLFWEIYTQSLQPYKRYRRSETPWWMASALSRDVDAASRDAARMETAERVAEYGTEVLVAIYESLPLESFQQEYECAFLDDLASWITWEEIRTNQVVGLKCPVAVCRGEATADARLAIQALVGMVERGEVEGQFAAGVDVGRDRNATELLLLGLAYGPGVELPTPVRLMITLERTPFPQQFDVLTTALRRLNVVKVLIDRNGMGRQLSEDLEREHPVVAEGVDFSAGSKVEWATALKVALQRHRLPLPVHRDLAYQIHSIRRLVSPTSRALLLDVAKTEKHHADKFWALALALAAAPRGGPGGGFGVQSYLPGAPRRSA